LEHGKFFERLSLHGTRPKDIIITDEFGFIVVFCESEIFVFTENGTEMLRRDFQFDAKRSIGFTYVDGADFVAFCDSQNELFVFEVFKLNVRQIERFSEQVLDLRYCSDTRGLFSLTSDGMMHFVPFLPFGD
jgi:hypothetical protein